MAKKPSQAAGSACSATDTMRSIIATIPIEIKTLGAPTLGVLSLRNVLRTLLNKPSRITSAENHWAKLSVARSSLKLMGQAHSDFRGLPDPKGWPPGCARIVYLRAPMTRWTPEELARVLDGRDRQGLHALVEHVTPAVIAGRALLLARRPYLRARNPSREDDVQEVLVALFKDNARVLRNFDPARQTHAAGTAANDALRRFVVGVAWNVLQRAYHRRWTRWEQLQHDLEAADDPRAQNNLARLLRVVDLERAVDRLSPEERDLFIMVYVEELSTAECCRRLRLTEENTLHARTSRLRKALRQLVSADSEALRHA